METKPLSLSSRLARFFVHNRDISILFLLAFTAWGYFGYMFMPARKDPEIQVRVAAAVTIWPGMNAEKIEQLVTRKVEEAAAGNVNVDRIESITRPSVSIVYIRMSEKIKETGKEFDDVKFRLDSVKLPSGCQPVNFIKDFGDTATLMITVASPKADKAELDLRAESIGKAISKARNGRSGRTSIVFCLPLEANQNLPAKYRDLLLTWLTANKYVTDPKPLQDYGFVGVDGDFQGGERQAQAAIARFFDEKIRSSDLHPDVWDPAVIASPDDIPAKLAAVAGAKYSYRNLDDYTDRLQKAIRATDGVAKVERSGLQEENIYLEYSQERLASYGISITQLPMMLSARNVSISGGVIQAGGRDIGIKPGGEFKTADEIGRTVIGVSPQGSPVYLRDVFSVRRDYANPATYLNFHTWKDSSGSWQRTRAITISIQMKPGEKIFDFGDKVTRTMNDVTSRLPKDLIIDKTSDQPFQVKEKIDLFMRSLYEAVVLLVLVALVGFWDWRAALLMAASIPLALSITFGAMYTLGLDLQQVSISSLILALGLLIDVPVVASDAIKREASSGLPISEAGWKGPSKLSKVIFYATITNIVAYLPFLMLSGDVGHFLYTMPIVITLSLLAAFGISMTLIPFIASHLLKPDAKPPLSPEEKRKTGFYGVYFRLGTKVIEHRVKTVAVALCLLALAGLMFSRLKTSFFPHDLSYLSYVDIWLPEDSSVSRTNESARRAERIIMETAKDFQALKKKGNKKEEVIKDLTTFVGGGGPRFWFSVAPQVKQSNYAQIIIQVNNNEDTEPMVNLLQGRLDAGLPGVRADVRMLETGKDVGIPVAFRISGDNITVLRKLAAELTEIFKTIPEARRIRDNWGTQTLQVDLNIDPDKAILSGVSNTEIAASAAAGINGFTVGKLTDGDRQIPITARLRMEERATLGQLKNIYVFSTQGKQRVPIEQAARIDMQSETQVIQRRNQFRTITVECFSKQGVLPSEIMKKLQPLMKDFIRNMPPGYKIEVGGEQEEQVKSFKELAVIMLISILAIYVALVFQFNSSIKPLIVFSSIPFGTVGAMSGLWLMDSPFGFMAFLGIASLIGVIISHVIVLFDFIEEMREKGEPLEQALLDAGIVRIRPVLVTVFATAIALIPLSLHGGPLWQPLCYAQIGGLLVATGVTLLLVPAIYAIFVKDLKWVEWKKPDASDIEE